MFISVDRLIKYSGYGNCAGLLASLGLLGGSIERDNDTESEDSETEEYEKIKHMWVCKTISRPVLYLEKVIWSPMFVIIKIIWSPSL